MLKSLGCYLKNNFYDKKFSSNKKKYVFQCFLATVVVYLVLTTLSVITNYLVIASIASTSFVIFAGPHSNGARARYVIGGYLVGILIGMLCYYLMIFCMEHMPSLHVHFDEIFAALAVGCSLFFMVVFDFEHPPACAASLALVINDWNFWVIGVTFFALFLLIFSRFLLRKHLIQLI